MEKIREIFSNLDKEFARDVDVNFLGNFVQTLESSKVLIDEIAEKKKKAAEDTKGKQTGMSLEEYFGSFDNFLTDIVDDVSEKFSIVINFTKKLSVDTSLKDFLVTSFDDMLESLTDETSRTFNRTTFEIFQEMMEDLKSSLQEKLMNKIDSEFLNIKDGFQKFGNISEIMENQFEGIKEKITSIKQTSVTQLKAVMNEIAIASEAFPKMDELLGRLANDYEDIQNTVNTKFTNIFDESIKLNSALKEAVNEEVANLNAKNALKQTELEWVAQFLEKSPKYQLLYIINNLEEAPMSKIKEMTRIDEGILNLSIEDLVNRDFITLSGEGENLTAKIKQKLNPLSHLELSSVFDSEAVQNFKNYSDDAAFEKGFDIILAQIKQHKDTNPEEAGYLLSVLYLYIFESGKYDFYWKIRSLLPEMRQDSFYLRMVSNAIHSTPWQSKKAGELEGMISPAKLTIFTDDLKTVDTTETGDGPYEIENYKILSLFRSEDAVQVKKSSLNRFSSIDNIVRWVWLEGNGTDFTIEFKDAKGKKHKINTTVTGKLEVQVYVKKREMLVD